MTDKPNPYCGVYDPHPAHRFKVAGIYYDHPEFCGGVRTEYQIEFDRKYAEAEAAAAHRERVDALALRNAGFGPIAWPWERKRRRKAIEDARRMLDIASSVQ